MRWLVVLAVGCYHANGLAPCETVCTQEDQTCPPGQACGVDGLCQSLTVTATCSEVAGDAGLDAAAPDAAQENCYGYALSGFAPLCDLHPTGTLELTMAIETDALPPCQWYAQAGSVGLCVYAAHDIVISQPIRVTGNRALVLVAEGEITVNNAIDASSRSYGAPGAGAGLPTCVTTAAPDNPSGGGGGAGGSLGGAGGMGGAGTAAVGAAASPIDALTLLHGGCPGTSGGGKSAANRSAGGLGGGAVYLIAHGQITLNGSIFASGAGAPAKAIAGSGGGGGGAGGMIVLEAPTITFEGTASLHADGGGGGGGGGSDNLASGDPKDGTNVSVAVPAAAAGGAGGGGGPTGGNGGTGSYANASGGDGKAATGANCGGGGGGGGAGAIIVKATTFGAGTHVVSPPAILR